MSVCVQADEDSGAEEPGAPVRDMYEHKAESKAVRVLTVLAYLFLVSLGAILLSVYYVCFWKAPSFNDTGSTGGPRAPQAHRTDYIDIKSQFNESGGTNSTVSIGVTALTPINITSLPEVTGRPPDSKPPDLTKPPTSQEPDTTDVIDVVSTTENGINTT